MSTSASVKILPEHANVLFQALGIPLLEDNSDQSLGSGSSFAILSLDSSTDHTLPYELESVPHFQHAIAVSEEVCVPGIGRSGIRQVNMLQGAF